jgi:hypothetical protein
MHPTTSPASPASDRKPRRNSSPSLVPSKISSPIRQAQGQAEGTSRNPLRSGPALEGPRHHHHRCAGGRHLGRSRRSRPRDDEAIKTLFTEFEFRSLTKRLFPDSRSVGFPAHEPCKRPEASESSATPGDPETPTLFETFKTIREVPHTYHLADTPELQQASSSPTLETKVLLLRHRNHRPRPLRSKAVRDRLLLESPRRLVSPYSESTNLQSPIPLLQPCGKIGHNLKFDLSILHHHGIEVSGPFFDTMLADTLVSPEQRHSMDYLSEILLGYTPVKLADIASASSIDHRLPTISSTSPKKPRPPRNSTSHPSLRHPRRIRRRGCRRHLATRRKAPPAA